jgi:hypothetical protein
MPEWRTTINLGERTLCPLAFLDLRNIAKSLVERKISTEMSA